MGVRSGGHPSVEQSFVQRLLHALNLTPSELANEVANGDIRVYQLTRDTLNEWANASPSRLPDVDRDAVWFAILEYIDQQYAYLMAAKHEVNTLLAAQRQHRALRTIQHRALGDVSAPTSLPRRQR